MFSQLKDFFQFLGQRAGIGLLSAVCFAGAPQLPAQGKSIAFLQDFVTAEVRQQGFTLSKAAKVHLHVKGGGSESAWNHDRELFAYGWILNATTREVVWQMSGANSQREGNFRVADVHIDLPAGSYEAYFGNHAFGRDAMFSHWNRNIDRRSLKPDGENTAGEGHGFLSLFGADRASQLHYWKERAQSYGMEISLPSSESVQTFTAPLQWKNILVSLTRLGDNEMREQRFQVKKAINLHIYAIGEGTRSGMVDYGWITDARTRKRVWEMTWDRAQYAGGAEKNRRLVETIKLPAGEYIASFGTDDSHSPADWNAAPPCDPLLHGLTLAVPSDSDFSQVALTKTKGPATVLAELTRAKDEQHYRADFSLKADQAVRVYAIGEGVSGRMADYAWIEDAKGHRVWTMERSATHHAGGARKNRMADEMVALPKGSYTLHFETDGSHAYGDWNADAPWDPEHYGVTVYARE